MPIDQAGRVRLADDPESLTRLEQLLLRYPALSQAEHHELGERLLQTGPLDMGLLSSNKAAWNKAEQYRADNPSVFRMSLSMRLWLIVLAMLAVAFVWWLWDIGVP